jgi:hypothetical protein
VPAHLLQQMCGDGRLCSGNVYLEEGRTVIGISWHSRHLDHERHASRRSRRKLQCAEVANALSVPEANAISTPQKQSVCLRFERDRPFHRELLRKLYAIFCYSCRQKRPPFRFDYWYYMMVRAVRRPPDALRSRARG